MKLIAKGATADIFSDSGKIIKLFNNNFIKSRVENEAKNQKLIYKTGLPVPKIFETIEIDGRFGIVMENIQGKSLGEKLFGTNDYLNGIDSNSKIYDDVIPLFVHTIIDVQIMVNTITLENFPKMKDRLKQKITNNDDINRHQKKILLDKINVIQFRNELCHGDFHPYNLIETDNGIKIIDWADSSIGNKEADIYRTYMIISTINSEIAEQYLEEYCKKTKENREGIILYEPIVIAARLSEHIKEFERQKIFHKLRNYL